MTDTFPAPNSTPPQAEPPRQVRMLRAFHDNGYHADDAMRALVYAENLRTKREHGEETDAGKFTGVEDDAKTPFFPQKNGEDALWSLVVHARRIADALDPNDRRGIVKSLWRIAVAQEKGQPLPGRDGKLSSVVEYLARIADALKPKLEAKSAPDQRTDAWLRRNNETCKEFNARSERPEPAPEPKPAPEPSFGIQVRYLAGGDIHILRDKFRTAEDAEARAKDHLRNRKLDKKGFYRVFDEKNMIVLSGEVNHEPRFELVIAEPGKHTTTVKDKFCSADDAAEYALDYFRNFGRTGTYIVVENGATVRRGEGIPF